METMTNFVIKMITNNIQEKSRGFRSFGKVVFQHLYIIYLHVPPSPHPPTHSPTLDRVKTKKSVGPLTVLSLIKRPYNSKSDNTDKFLGRQAFELSGFSYIPILPDRRRKIVYLTSPLSLFQLKHVFWPLRVILIPEFQSWRNIVTGR